MNLHAIPEAEAPEEDPEFEFDGSCPECGDRTWKRRETGWKAERHEITFPGGIEDWEILDEGIEDTEQWKCWRCGHTATDEEDEWIEAHR